MLEVEIDGAEELDARLAAMPQALRAALAAKIEDLASRLEEKIEDNLSGKVLRSRSGALRDSIDATTGADAARLFAKTKYAAAQEYGFSGAESVSAFSRTIKQAFGRAIAPKQVFVRAFSRQMNLPERSYMRSALDEMQDDIAAELAEVIREGLSA
jgi:phage gpG-like protein